MKKHSKREVIYRVGDVLISRNKPEDAIELKELCMLAGVSEEEALMAIKYFIDDEFKIKLTDGLPHKFYCE